MKIWTCGSSPQSGSQDAWTRIKNVNGASRLSKFWNFFGTIQMIYCCDWWLWMKPFYITMTCRQSNYQWSDSTAAYPAPKNSKSKNPLEKFSPWYFRIKTASSSLIIFQRATLSMQSITHLYWCDWRTFWREIAAGRSPKWSSSCTTMPNTPGTCYSEETCLPGLPMSWPPTLFSGSGPVELPPVPWTEKRIESLLLFIWSKGHCCLRDLVGGTTFWIFFLVACKS
jgi:hypothetical protein